MLSSVGLESHAAACGRAETQSGTVTVAHYIL